MAVALMIRRLLVRRARAPPPLSSSSAAALRPSPLLEASVATDLSCGGGALLSPSRAPRPLNPPSISSAFFCSRPSKIEEAQMPEAKDYRYVLPEDEFHRLADATIHDLLEKLEEYGDSIQIDGFDIDYGNQVLTLKLGSLGTYVINKQTPNRQIWLSSPVSGPARFDWDETSKCWVYRRTKANLLQLVGDELGQLCGEPITLY